MAAWAAVLAVAAVLGQAPAASAASCSGQRVASLQRGSFRKKVRAVKTHAELARVLADLGWPGAVPTVSAECPSIVVDVTADVFPVRLVDGKTEDLVVQVRGKVCGRTALFGVVLHPLAESSRSCSLKLPFLPGLLENGSEVKFGFASLTDPSRQVFRVDSVDVDQTGRTVSVEFWEVQEGRVARIFSGGYYDQEVGFDHSSTEYKLLISGDTFPKRLTERREVTEDSTSGGGTRHSTESSEKDHCYGPAQGPQPSPRDGKVRYLGC